MKKFEISQDTIESIHKYNENLYEKIEYLRSLRIPDESDLVNLDIIKNVRDNLQQLGRKIQKDKLREDCQKVYDEFTLDLEDYIRRCSE